MNPKQGNFEKASKLKYETLVKLEKKAEELSAATEQQLLPLEVDEKEIADLVSRATGIPVSRMLGAERERLLGMEDTLKQKVVNQDQAIASICIYHRGDTTRSHGLVGSQPAQRYFHVSRCHWRGQDRNGQGTSGIFVRQRAAHDSH